LAASKFRLACGLADYLWPFDGPAAPWKLSPAELRRLNSDLSFYWNAGAPPLPRIEETAINVPSGRVRVRLYDPGIAMPGPSAIFLHGGGWVFGSLILTMALRGKSRTVQECHALLSSMPLPQSTRFLSRSMTVLRQSVGQHRMAQLLAA
jgi:hypothetical protein